MTVDNVKELKEQISTMPLGRKRRYCWKDIDKVLESIFGDDVDQALFMTIVKLKVLWKQLNIHHIYLHHKSDQYNLFV